MRRMTRRTIGLLLVALTGPAGGSDELDDPSDRAAARRPPRTTSAPHEEPPGGEGDPTPDFLGAAACGHGVAGAYPCHDVDLLAVVPAIDMGGTATTTANDVWGWMDTSTGREYALVGLANGTAFLDVSEPHAPVFVGHLPTRTLATPWRGIKVYRDHAYVVADRAGVHGMQVFDLTRLRGAAPDSRFTPDAQYFGPGLGVTSGFVLGSAHNVAINEETGFAYLAGSDTCAGGLHMVDLREPRRPRFAGCFSADGYTHDTQCVIYRGPDSSHRGREICFAANEDTLTLVDVTDKLRPRQISRTGYGGAAYTHQGWLTADQRYFLVDDELDEMRFGHRTRTYIWDLVDLDAPRLIGAHTAASPATDHNLFIRGRHVFESNYRSGLRILDLAEVGAGRLREVAFFDVVPGSDAAGFSGAWGNYPFLPSGIVLVSGIEQGLFILRPHLEEH